MSPHLHRVPAGNDMVAQAEAFARRARQGQVDKAGAPYATHPERVAGRVAPSPFAQAAAWLHDVVEDTPITLDDLTAEGFPAEVVAAVGALTRGEREPADDYYARVAADPLALQVKWADLADNASAERMALLDEQTQTRLRAKYRHAIETLTRLSTQQPQR